MPVDHSAYFPLVLVMIPIVEYCLDLDVMVSVNHSANFGSGFDFTELFAMIVGSFGFGFGFIMVVESSINFGIITAL